MINITDLVQLETKFDAGGIRDEPITDGELKQLLEGLTYITQYFRIKKENTVFMGCHMKREAVKSTIAARRL